jgi:2-polyprenyl-3-methyl-5-hydroxy-6-metoxy-1,4-benzoquinol methylase
MSDYQEYGYKTSEPCHTFYYIHKPLLSLLDKNTNKCILDLGCGNGYIANYLIGKGFNVYGTDASNDGIKIARKQNPNRFFTQDFSTDDLPKELQGIEFDTIISTEVIEHLYDPYKFADLCKKILAQNKGELILSTPYHGYIKNLLLSIFNKWDAHISPLWQGGHIKFWSKSTVTQLLNQQGFKVTGFKGCGRVPYFWMSMIIKAKLE